MRFPLLVSALAICLAAPGTAWAVAELQVSEHLVPASARTGELVHARVTVTNLGDTPTEGHSEISWFATNGEGFIVGDFAIRAPLCPPGSEPLGPGPQSTCLVSSPIEPGASLTAVFSGSSRHPFELEARARAWDRQTDRYHVDEKPLTITGPTLPEPAAPRVSRLRIEDPRLTQGQQAVLRFSLDRATKSLGVGLLKCLGPAGCRLRMPVVNSTITRRGHTGPNTLRYRLPARLAPGRYRIRVWAFEPLHRVLTRSVPLRVLPRRR